MIAAWAEEQYTASGIMDQGPHQQAGLQVVAALLKQSRDVGAGKLPSIPVKQWRRVVGSKEAQEALTKEGRVFR